MSNGPDCSGINVNKADYQLMDSELSASELDSATSHTHEPTLATSSGMGGVRRFTTCMRCNFKAKYNIVLLF